MKTTNLFALSLVSLACAGLAWYCLRWSRRLPETASRRLREPEFSLFE